MQPNTYYGNKLVEAKEFVPLNPGKNVPFDGNFSQQGYNPNNSYS